MKNKVVVIDWGIAIHRAGYANVPNSSPAYLCMSMILSNLKLIKWNKNDIVIVAVDGGRSWRKDYEQEYKANRKKQREKSGKDWTQLYKDFDRLLEQIDISTNWHIVNIKGLEADDIMAVASRYYNDREVVLVTYDSDLEQMWAYDNVKIFSPHPKSKKYKIPPKNFNVYKLIGSKIKKEASDNLTSPVITDQDYQKRKICVNLLQLPEWVEGLVVDKLDNIKEKENKLHLFPYPKLIDRFEKIYYDSRLF